MHAGYGDPDFYGQWTLELVNSGPWPISLQAGRPYTQMTIEELDEEAKITYADTGRYQGQMGATPARGDPIQWI